MTSEKSKEDYYRDAAQYLNRGEQVGTEGVSGTLAFLTRGALYMQSGQAVAHQLVRDSTTRYPIHG